jgi:hypothetical protein
MFEFHPKAQESFSNKAVEILQSVKSFPLVQGVAKDFEIHPSAVIDGTEMIGEPRITERELDLFGIEIGRMWTHASGRFGWSGEAYQKIKLLAETIARITQLNGLVSEEFIFDEIFDWLCQTSEGTRSDSISQFILSRCIDEIKDHTIYVPLCRVHSSKGFKIGDVEFKTITKKFLDDWFSNKPSDNPVMAERVAQLEHQTRAKYQGHIAACIEIRAEGKKASQLALSKTLMASALLRIISPANWTSKIKSYALPIGMENTEVWHSFTLVGYQKIITSDTYSKGPYEWVLDEPIEKMGNILESLSQLYSGQKTEFQRVLFDAILIYSRNSTTTDPADKLVFVLVSLESILLKDANEPIQSNLGERMAFLIGQSLDDRKKIVDIAKKTYAIRSRFIHHGQGIEELNTLDQFLFFAWLTFVRLIEIKDNIQTRHELIVRLDEMKLS